MKTMKFFYMVAASLMMTACSHDDNTMNVQNSQKSKGIPFTATIGLDADAATRGLWIDDDNNQLVAKFKANEKIALVYKVGSQSYNTPATITEVDDETGVATISATLEDGVVNGTPLTIIYPSDAADGATGNIKSDLLAEQNGLAGNPTANVLLDVRKGTGIVSIFGDKAVMGSATKLVAQYAFCKYTLGLPAGTLQPLYIKDNATGKLITTVTPSNPLEEIWVALEPATSKSYKFELTSVYNRILKVGTATIQAGKYYRTGLPARYPLEMSKLEKGIDEGCIIAGNGKIYMNKTGVIQASETAEAMVALIGQAANNTYGLGIALIDAKLDNIGDPAGEYWTKTTSDDPSVGLIPKFAAKHPVEGGTWRLPTKNDWEMMFRGCSLDTDYALIDADIDTDLTIKGFKDKLNAASAMLALDYAYWTGTLASTPSSYEQYGYVVNFIFGGEEAKAQFFVNGNYPHYVRACLAF